jgi:hypothetical protein
MAWPEAPKASAAVRPAASSVPSAPATPNPALRLDPGLGLVVLQFRDTQGEVVATLPTERELAAYRYAGKQAASTPSAPADAPAARPPGPAPASGTAPSPATAEQASVPVPAEVARSA